MPVIEYVKVDYRDRRPTTDYPARHGPDDPIPGIAWWWTWPGTPIAPAPRYLGEAPEDAALDTPGILRVLTQDDVDAELDRRRAFLREQINAERDRRLYPGTLEAEGVALDLRHARDETNLLHLRSEALQRQAAGDATPLEFRDAHNTTRELSPATVIAMTDAAIAHGKGVYRHSWQLKDALDAATTAEALKAVRWDAGT